MDRQREKQRRRQNNEWTDKQKIKQTPDTEKQIDRQTKKIADWMD